MGEEVAAAFALVSCYSLAGFVGSLAFGTFLVERMQSLQLWVSHYPSRHDPEFVAYAALAAPGRSV